MNRLFRLYHAMAEAYPALVWLALGALVLHHFVGRIHTEEAMPTSEEIQIEAVPSGSGALH